MEIFGLPLETIYLYTLIISGVLTLLFILFGDILSGLEAPDYLNPVLILAFLTVFGASGYLFEKVTNLHSGLSAVISGCSALLIVSLLNIFILIPLSSAEESLSISESDLKGRIGKVLTSVPVDGFGEVLIESASGSIAKPAVSFDNEAIPEASLVLVIEVKNGVLHVLPHQQIEIG
ncbi:NfeD family protein [Peribacillus loiseleuriae]|uniref:Membrane protein n=1 Tax=Peribacillus loiseleuriae TaxID=1679170 RepID=A0A0K9GUW2_9BACI|nr:NfeD family protein [Peribacillus loiseleuriae]KMY50445.1 membrane protein [Peribacillus loiseleuriae]